MNNPEITRKRELDCIVGLRRARHAVPQKSASERSGRIRNEKRAWVPESTRSYSRRSVVVAATWWSSSTTRVGRFLVQVDYFRVARDSGTIAIRITDDVDRSEEQTSELQ